MTGIILALHRHDERVLHYVVSRRYRALDAVMRALTHLADPLPAILMSLWLGKRACLTLALSHALVQILKRSFCRARPALPVGIGSLVTAPDRFSFPSGHAAAAMSVALGVCAVVGGGWIAPVIALAAVIGFSRSYLGVHYPGDVLMGFTLAVLSFRLASMLL